MKAFPRVPLSRAEFFSSSFWHKITPFMVLSQTVENLLFLVSTYHTGKYVIMWNRKNVYQKRSHIWGSFYNFDLIIYLGIFIV